MRKLMIFKLSIVAAVALLLAGCAEPPYTNLDNEGLQRLLAHDVPVVDIRRPEEWRETGVVEGSERMTFVDANGRLKPGFMQRFAQRFDPNEPVVLICRTGNRTDVLGRHLVEQMGYTQVYNVRNGIVEWIRRGNPVSRG